MTTPSVMPIVVLCVWLGAWLLLWGFGRKRASVGDGDCCWDDGSDPCESGESCDAGDGGGCD